MQLQQSLVTNSRNPQWWLSLAHLLRLMGYPSFITTVISFLVYYYKRYEHVIRRNSARGSPFTKLIKPPTGHRKLLESAGKTNSNMNSFGYKFLDTFRMKKRLVISLKNTLLWNPSADIDAPNHAFKENAITLIQKLSTTHHLYLLLHYNSIEEYNQVQRMFSSNASLRKALYDQQIVFCGSLAEKFECMSLIRPDIYVEGGSENEDGWETIQFLLNDYVNKISKIIWIATTHGSLVDSPKHISSSCTSIAQLNDKLECVATIFYSSIAST